MSKTVLITGAAKGIGAAIAKAFVKNNDQVILHYRSSENEVLALKKECESLGKSPFIVQADLNDDASLASMFQTITEKNYTIDVLINNAGMTHDQLFMRMSYLDFDNIIQTNLGSTVKCSKAVIRPMMKNGFGRIINISSVVGTIGNPGQTNYAASKAAIEVFSKSLAKEVAKKNVTVNCVAPGFIDTDMTKDLSETIKELYLAQIPANRFGSAEDVASAVLFLASEEASYITGQTIHVNGGMI
jgi:3-oxoacyl-[acyl-carrier protein] reductase